MYPIISVLRRCCAKVLYVSGSEPFLENAEGALRLKLEAPAQVADFTTLQWGPPRDLAALYLCLADGPTQIDVARFMTNKENLLAAGLNAIESVYTLILGEENEEATSDGFRRTVRIGAVRGVFRPPEFFEKNLVSVPAKRVRGARFRDLPLGVIPQKR